MADDQEVKFIVSVDDQATAPVQSMADNFQNLSDSATSSFDTISSSADGVDSSFSGLDESASSTSTSMDDLASSSESAGGSLESAGSEAEGAGSSFEQLQGTVEGIKGSLDTLKGGLEGVGALFVADKVKDVVGEYSEFGTELSHLHEQTGISVGDLSALSAQADINHESFQSVVMSIGLMQRNLDGVTGPSTVAQGALDDLGVPLHDFQQLKPEDQFLRIGDTLAKIEDPGRRAADAAALFGRQGRTLLPFFDQGNASMEAMIANAKSLGTYMGDDDAKAAFEAQKGFDSVGEAMKGVVLNTGKWIDQNPSVIEGVKDMVAAIEGLGNALAVIIQSFQQAASAASDFAYNATASLGDALKGRATLTTYAQSVGTTAKASKSTVSHFKSGGGLASGGTALPGNVYDIGEDGPETLYMGDSGGYVVPSSNTNRGGNIFNITLSGPISSREVAMQMADEVVKYCKAHMPMMGGI